MESILAGKVVIITGASSGIGAATARLLAGYQCKLVLAARSVDKMETLAAGDMAMLSVRAMPMSSPCSSANRSRLTLWSGQAG